MLHPTLFLDGTIDDVTNWEAFSHFFTIGWKLLAALVPPPHYLRGWPAFIISLVFIGFQALFVIEYSKLLACSMNLG